MINLQTEIVAVRWMGLWLAQNGKKFHLLLSRSYVENKKDKVGCQKLSQISLEGKKIT